MENDVLHKQLLNTAQELKHQLKTNDEIYSHLLQQCNNPTVVYNIILELKRAQHKQQCKEGAIKLLIGILSLGIGFLLTIVNFHNNVPFTTIMYSFTCVGLGFVFWGLYKIIG